MYIIPAHNILRIMRRGELLPQSLVMRLECEMYVCMNEHTYILIYKYCDWVGTPSPGVGRYSDRHPGTSTHRHRLSVLQNV